MVSSLDFIQYPQFEKTLTQFDIYGVPYFFGICTFAFEGTSVTLEIYRQMENKRSDFNMSMAVGISIATFIFQLTGILVY